MDTDIYAASNTDTGTAAGMGRYTLGRGRSASRVTDVNAAVGASRKVGNGLEYDDEGVFEFLLDGSKMMGNNELRVRYNNRSGVINGRTTGFLLARDSDVEENNKKEKDEETVGFDDYHAHFYRPRLIPSLDLIEDFLLLESGRSSSSGDSGSSSSNNGGSGSDGINSSVGSGGGGGGGNGSYSGRAADSRRVKDYTFGYCTLRTQTSVNSTTQVGSIGMDVQIWMYR
jgi:hypothetical protein